MSAAVENVKKEVLAGNIPSIGIKALKEELSEKLEAGEMTSVLLIARHGVGKSQAVAQWIEQIGYNMIDKRLSCSEVGDIVGIPKEALADNGVPITVWLKPDWFPLKGKDFRVILFLDEYIRANRDVKNASMQIILDRKLNGWSLPDDCLVIAAINDGEEYDVVGGLDPAQQDRFQIYRLEPTFEEWMEWAEGRGKINRYIIDFLKTEPTYLDPPHLGEEDYTYIQKHQSRRSWEKLSNRLNYRCKDRAPSSSDLIMSASYIGLSTATVFTEHCAKKVEDIPLDEILNSKGNVFDDRREAYWKDITLCMKSLDRVVDHTLSLCQDEEGFVKCEENLLDEDLLHTIANLVRGLYQYNREACANFWLKLALSGNGIDLVNGCMDKYGLEKILDEVLAIDQGFKGDLNQVAATGTGG